MDLILGVEDNYGVGDIDHKRASPVCTVGDTREVILPILLRSQQKDLRSWVKPPSPGLAHGLEALSLMDASQQSKLSVSNPMQRLLHPRVGSQHNKWPPCHASFFH